MKNINYLHKFEISEEFKNLFINIISFEPNKRYSIQEILQSNWMKEINKMFEEKAKILNDMINKINNKFKTIRKDIMEKNEKIYN